MKIIPTIDLHQDLWLHKEERDLFDNKWQTNFSMLAENEVKVTVATAFPYPENGGFFDPKTNDLIEEQFKNYNEFCKQRKEWQIIKDRQDLQEVLDSENKFGLILHVEGLNVFPKKGLERLQSWYDMGWRSMGLVWNHHNDLGGGTKNDKQDLTEKGKKVLSWLEKKDMIIDLAHMNRKTFSSAIDYIKKPALVSHGNSNYVFKNQRNITDEQLKKIEKTKGVIGVFFSDKYVSNEQSSLADIVEHIKYIVDKIGIDHVAIGSDFGGILSGTPQNLTSVKNLNNLWTELKQDGFSIEEIEKISFKNAKRVLSNYLQ